MLVETAAAAAVRGGRLLEVVVVAEDREGWGLTRNAEVHATEDSNSIPTGRKRALHGRCRRGCRGILHLLGAEAGGMDMDCVSLSLPMCLCNDDDDISCTGCLSGPLGQSHSCPGL